MEKINLHLKISDFIKVHSKLKKLESKDQSMKINGIPISSFLTANSSFGDNADPPEIRTKRIILQIAGDFSSKPEDLNDNIKLKINLLYGNDEYSLLQIRLNSLVKEYKKTASMTNDETNNCSSVGDCTRLVNSKIK
jgi:hypothetical protein